jgi:hypothetical protein
MHRPLGTLLLAVVVSGPACTLTGDATYYADVPAADHSARDIVHHDVTDVATRVDVSQTDAGDLLDVVSVDQGRVDGPDASDVVDGGVPAEAGRVPLNHRADDSPCSLPAPAGNCTLGGACRNDSMCLAGIGGRCTMTMSGAVTCRCTYDACARDSECPTGETCACHGTALTLGNGSTCVAGDCRVDSDCGAGGYCSPSPIGTSCGGIAGYYCHTDHDTCIDDTDCGSSGMPQVCAYSVTAGNWQCIVEHFCL